ncbi:MAG: hypothetical protein WCR72_04900 [Bacteroidota bacterium]
MASNSETGHSVNISNFKLLIDKCTALGAPYNPSNTDLTIDFMTGKWRTADTAHQAVTRALQLSKKPVNDRQLLFDPADKLVTRTLNYYNSTKASPGMKASAKGLADRFRGYGSEVPKLADGTPDPAYVSNSQQSFVQKGDILRQLADLYASDDQYAPNEKDLDTEALASLAAAMKTANDTLGEILAPLEIARITRNHALYDAQQGILDIAQACKNYVKGAFGARAPETRGITGIRFTRP